MTAQSQQFGRYSLLRKIGEGGMAEVFLATVAVAEGLHKRVVVKKIRRDCAGEPEYARMFVDEAKIALGLNHANIVQVFDFGQVQGDFYLAMELVEGVDLMRLLHAVHGQGERVPTVIAAYIAHQVAAGLAYAHHKRDDFGEPIGIVHRDISPHNIMLSFAGTVKILDFGIARPVAGRGATPPRRRGREGGEEETIQGKVAYMAPEQALGRRVDPRADIYALGIVLYEMLTGALVYRGRSLTALLEEVRTRALPAIDSVVPDLAPELVAVTTRALARDPDARWESARAMQSALASFLHRADPVVDDEVLSHYIARYFPAAAPLPGAREAQELEATRELSDHAGERLDLAPHRDERPVVLLRAVLGDHADAGEDGLTRGRERFLALAQAVAFKREAHVCRLGGAAIVLAFGVLPIAQSPAAEALRVALALREAIGEAAPGLAIGVAIARAPVHIHRIAGSALVVEVDDALDRHLAAIAAAALDGPVMLVGEVAEELGKTWRLGEPQAQASDASFLAPWAQRLEQATPVLGPQSAIDPRIPHTPGARAVIHGRELELKALRDGFVEAIRARSARAILVSGGAGLGKRTLLERFIAQIPRGAAQILRVSGQWRRRNIALGALQGLLARSLGIQGDTTRGEVEARLRAHRIDGAGELAGALAAALGLPGSEPDESDPRERREAQGRLFQRLIAALGQRRPVLVVLEALHFADEESIDVLAGWLRGAPQVPVLVVMTSRPSSRQGLLRGIAGLTVVELRELDERARHELIIRRFEDPEDAEELAQAILARTAGNPLFIEETLAMLLRQGVLGWDALGRYLVVRQRGARIEVPPSVEAALCTRLDALDPGDRELVEAAAILGQSFRPAEVDQLVSRASARPLARLCDLGIFEPDPAGAIPGALRFTSVSLHEICKQAMAQGLAERLHGHAVAIRRARLDYRPGRDDGPIADHLVLAGRAEEAIEPALRAARAAHELAGNVEAHYYLSLALRALPPGDPRRFEILAQREPILRAWGHRRLQGADIRQMIELAIERGDPDQEVAASLRLLRFYLECERTHHAEQLIPRIEARLRALADPSPFLAVLGELRADLLIARGALAEAERVAQEALGACAEGREGQAQRTRLVLRIGRAQLGMGRFGEATQALGDALRLARSIGDRRVQADALNLLGEVAGRSTRYQQAIDHFLEALQIDRDLGDRVATGVKLANLGITYAAAGLYRRAERYLRKAFELHEALGNAQLLGDVVVHLGEVLAELGDLQAARSLLVDAATMAQRRGDLRTELRAHARLAGVLLDQHGDDDGQAAAVELAEQVLRRAREASLRTAAVRALHVLSLAAERRGDLAGAISREREAVALVRAGAAPIDGVLSLHHLGLLLAGASPGESQEWLAEAARVTQARLDDLRDPELRRAYLAQPKVQALLAGRSIAAGPAEPTPGA